MKLRRKSDNSVEYEPVVDGLGITHWLPKRRHKSRGD